MPSSTRRASDRTSAAPGRRGRAATSAEVEELGRGPDAGTAARPWPGRARARRPAARGRARACGAARGSRATSARPRRERVGDEQAARARRARTSGAADQRVDERLREVDARLVGAARGAATGTRRSGRSAGRRWRASGRCPAAPSGTRAARGTRRAPRSARSPSSARLQAMRVVGGAVAPELRASRHGGGRRRPRARPRRGQQRGAAARSRHSQPACAVPGGGARDALVQVHLRRVAEQAPGLLDREGAALRPEVDAPAVQRRLDARSGTQTASHSVARPAAAARRGCGTGSTRPPVCRAIERGQLAPATRSAGPPMMNASPTASGRSRASRKPVHAGRRCRRGGRTARPEPTIA